MAALPAVAPHYDLAGSAWRIPPAARQGHQSTPSSALRVLCLRILGLRHRSAPSPDGVGRGDCVAFKFVHRTSQLTVVVVPGGEQRTVSLAFRTPPVDDSGVAHAVEHLVLCGSAKYPARDAFFAATSRLLTAYSNARTGVNHTVYTVSSPHKRSAAKWTSLLFDLTLRPTLHPLDFYKEVFHVSPGG
eukprot:Sspe_Gene.110176::Locus_90557_Transcript_1_2_Confidence_0.429_Length_640::g.110176::m.110176